MISLSPPVKNRFDLSRQSNENQVGAGAVQKDDFLKEDWLADMGNLTLKSGPYKQPGYANHHLILRSIIGTTEMFKDGKEIKKQRRQRNLRRTFSGKVSSRQMSFQSRILGKMRQKFQNKHAQSTHIKTIQWFDEFCSNTVKRINEQSQKE